MKHLFLRLLALIGMIALIVLAWTFWGGEPAPAPEEPEPTPALEVSYTNTSPDEIVVTSPAPGELLTSPLTIKGRARGSWYFEATAPVVLVNWDGLVIAEGYVTATDNWMTEDFVDFEGALTFPKPAETSSDETPAVFLYPQGSLILKNSNASGLPEYDRAVEIPIRFF